MTPFCGAMPSLPSREDEDFESGIRDAVQRMLSEQLEEFRSRLAFVEASVAEVQLAVAPETRTKAQIATDIDECWDSHNGSQKVVVMLGESDDAQEEPSNQAQDEFTEEEPAKAVSDTTVYVSSRRQILLDKISAILTRPAEQIAEFSEELSRTVSGLAKVSDSYKVEESIYGLLALPGLPLRFGACFLVLVFYCLTSGLIMIIYHSMLTNAQHVRAELYEGSDIGDPLCEKVLEGDGYTWVCSPPSLVKLMDFNQLDLDGDGVWSVVEARNSSLLMYFRALNEVALEQEEMLANIFPPKEPVPDSFCMVILPLGTTNANLVNVLSEADQLEMFWSSGRMEYEHMLGCNLTELLHIGPKQDSPMDRPSYECLLDRICPDRTTPMVPGSSSLSQFYEATSQMALVPRFLHNKLVENMLRPCRLLDGELCANADVQQHSLLSEVWPDLNLDKAVEKCSEWITSTCPRLLGDDFKAFQARMGVACGEREYEIVPKSAITPWHTSESTVDLQCEDPEDGGRAILQNIVNSMFESIPVFNWVAWAQEAYYGFPRGTVIQMLDCNIGSIGFRFQWGDTEFTDPATNTTRSVADVFGRACPMTSCKRDYDQAVPSGCPEQCLHKADLANNVTDPFRVSWDTGEYTQAGRCRGFHTEVDNVTGALKVSRFYPMYPGYLEHCKLLLNFSKTARLYITKWNIPMRKASVSNQNLCLGDFLMIDGKKHCTTEKPAAVNLEPKAGSFTKLVWRVCETCGDFDYDIEGYDKWSPTGFELIIVDAAVPSKHSLVTVSFALHRWFWDEVNGVTAPSGIFHAFLVLIMLVWIGYLGEEFFHSLNYVKFIMQTFKGLRQVLLLLFLALPRFLVWGFVLYTGVLLLATVHSYIEIVLNSVALAFVLEFDEYLFVMAVPHSLKQCIKDREVFTLERWCIERWISATYNTVALDGKIIVRMLSFILIAVLVVQGLYAVDWFGSPHFNLISEVYDCMCALRGPHCPAY